MTVLPRRLADASRLALGSLEICHKETRPGEVVRRLIDNLDPKTAQRMRLTAEEDKDAGLGSQRPSNTWVANLLTNADKFSPAGSPIGVHLSSVVHRRHLLDSCSRSCPGLSKEGIDPSGDREGLRPANRQHGRGEPIFSPASDDLGQLAVEPLCGVLIRRNAGNAHKRASMARAVHPRGRCRRMACGYRCQAARGRPGGDRCQCVESGRH